MFSWNFLIYSVKNLRFELTIFSFFFLHTDRWTLHWWQELYPLSFFICTNMHWYFILFVQRGCVVLSQGLFSWSFLSVVFFLRGFVGTYRMSAERASQLINLHRASTSPAAIIHLWTVVNSRLVLRDIHSLLNPWPLNY